MFNYIKEIFNSKKHDDHICPNKEFDYQTGKVPATYKCSKCERQGVKLWRNITFAVSSVELICGKCACKEENREFDIDHEGYMSGDYGRTDQFWDYLPAVPTKGNESYWGYTSVPNNGVTWWRTLPTD